MALRPVLRPVKNSRDLNRVWMDLINDYVRQRRERQLAPPGHPAAGSSKIGEILRATALFINGSSNAAGSFGIVAVDPLANAL
jgi:hypothetical protein